ncbi:hypothetical protein [Marinicauda algicola]|uniref:hypothetical protein n=1 Tax=Marinicauda algicola TaxID=2029849 RepID=UPI0013052888|nr:hypothetical protein [Marinicauda algicola]
MRNSLKTLAALILALAAFAAFAPKEWRVVAEAAAASLSGPPARVEMTEAGR